MEPDTVPASSRPRRTPDRGLIIASIVLASGVVLVGFALLRSTTGDERTNLPDAIERISPLPDAINVPNQTTIVVDLADGYVGRLEIDGQTFEAPNAGALDLGASDSVPTTLEPGVQIVREAGLRFTPGVNTLVFTPGDAVGFERWAPGEHLVAVQYWPIEDGPDEAETYRWQFTIV